MGFLSKLGEGIAGQVRVWFGKPRIIFKEALVMERVYKKLAHQTYGVGGVRGKAISTAEKVFLAKKKKMIQEILHHAISKEIANGPTAHHKTGILGEIDKPMGNLYSFFGFSTDGKQIIEKLREAVQTHTTINKQPKVKTSPRRLRYQFVVRMPTNDAISRVTGTDWGTSWAWTIEKGGLAANVQYYLYNRSGKYPSDKKNKNRPKRSMQPPSRRGTAIQVKGKPVNPGRRFTTKQYLTPILKKFRDSILNPKSVAR